MGVVLSKEVTEVTAPGELGEFGVLKDHTEFMTTLVPGRLSYVANGGAKAHVVVGQGFAEVLPDKTTVLVDMAIESENIDLQAAKKDLEEAEKALEGIEEEDDKFEALEAAHLMARIKVDVKEGAQ